VAPVPIGLNLSGREGGFGVRDSHRFNRFPIDEQRFRSSEEKKSVSSPKKTILGSPLFAVRCWNVNMRTSQKANHDINSQMQNNNPHPILGKRLDYQHPPGMGLFGAR